MTEIEFKIWLQGYIDLSEETYFDSQQLNILINHAKLVIATKGEASVTMNYILSTFEIWRNKAGNIKREEVRALLK